MNLALSESLGKSFALQKESTQTELRNLSYEQKKFEFKSDLIQNFKTFKNMFKLFYWIEGIITKKWALVSLDLDKRAKSCDHLTIRD